MMRFCPKCRAFYDDEWLKFCLNDGVPLIEIGQTDELWEQGSKALSETESIVRRQTLRQNLKKMIISGVTTILVTMVISVITLNSWIYLNPPEKEISRNELPPPESNPQPTPQPESGLTPSPIAESTAESTPSPSPTAEPTLESTPDQSNPQLTPDNSMPDDSTPLLPTDPTYQPPTVEETLISTPKESPSPSATIRLEDTPSETPAVCSNAERKDNENRIADQFGGSWRERFTADRERILRDKIRELIKECEKNAAPDSCRYLNQETQAELSQNPTFLLAISGKNCQLVTITAFFEWRFTIPQKQTAPKKVRKTFIYQKQGEGWTLASVF